MLPDYRDLPGSTGIYGGFVRRAHAVHDPPTTHNWPGLTWTEVVVVGRCFLRHRPAQVPGPGDRRGSPGPGLPSFRACACACWTVLAPAASRLFASSPSGSENLRGCSFLFLRSVSATNEANSGFSQHPRPCCPATELTRTQLGVSSKPSAERIVVLGQHHRFVGHIFDISFS